MIPPEKPRRLSRAERLGSIDAAVNSAAARNLPALLTCHEVASTFFGEQSTGMAYTRKPSLSVTVPVQGEPPATLAIFPRWYAHKKTLDTNVVIVELLLECLKVGGCQLRTREIALSISASGVKWTHCVFATLDKSLPRLLSAIDALLKDPAGLFVASPGRCCICRKKLSDGASLARGVGPECLRMGNRFLELILRLSQREKGAASPECAAAPDSATIVSVEQEIRPASQAKAGDQPTLFATQ
jgi:hypothetical protein